MSVFQQIIFDPAKHIISLRCDSGQYTAVAEDPETMRVKKNMTTISNVAYHGEMMRKQEMENARPAEIEGKCYTQHYTCVYDWYS